MFKSNRPQKTTLLLMAGLLSLVAVLGWTRGSLWTSWDYQVLDIFYRKAVKAGQGPPVNPRIAIITITEETKGYYGQTILDRSIFADVNKALKKFEPHSVVYDIIFPRKLRPQSDLLFEESLKDLGNAFLPIAFQIMEKGQASRNDEIRYYRKQLDKHLVGPVQKGSPRPYRGIPSQLQYESFFEHARGSGHVNVPYDPDGVYRHIPLVIQFDSRYFPALSLSVFLNYIGVPLSSLEIDWGKELRIPHKGSKVLKRDLVIPIDRKGNVFLPYAQFWESERNNFQQLPIHTFLTLSEDPDVEDRLRQLIKGEFVFIADVSQSSSDTGKTPLENQVPLISMHVSLLNGLLNQTFYKTWPLGSTLAFNLVIGLLLWFSTLTRRSWIPYVVLVVIVAGLALLTGFEFSAFRLFPIVSVTGTSLFLFVGLIGGLLFSGARERKFIHNAFSKYVPKEVVNRLLETPELLRPGGEERVLTVLFSDLENFTTISETMKPVELVKLLNEYFTEMTRIIHEEGGIIDKYQGDAIMAEFGAPIPLEDHADRALRTGLKMQRRLEELSASWQRKGYPQLRCRVGINTGPMVIGNLGSQDLFDYTVIGDSVNVASRLEGANKIYGTYIIHSQASQDQLTPGLFQTRILDLIQVKGKTEVVTIYEVYGEAGDRVESVDREYYQSYDAGYKAYLAKQFSEARKHFESALTLRPHDPASLGFIERIGSVPSPLPMDWDGSSILTTK